MRRGTIRTTATGRKPGALIVGGDYRGLGVARSLGRRGIPVWLLTDRLSVVSFSRYTRKTLWWPPSERAQVQMLLDLAEKEDLKGWAVFPTRDVGAALLARHHEQLSKWLRLSVPPWDTVRWFYDKRLTYHLAAQHGVDHPWTVCPQSRDQVAELECEFPVILKPAVKERTNRFTSAKAWRVENRESLLARYDEAATLVPPDSILIQQLLPPDGAQYAYTALCRDGQVLASAVTGNNRQWPIDFGRASTYIETVEHPAVEEAGRRLLEAVHYTGIAQVQFKVDASDGSPKLLDINPRFWGSHSLTQYAGVDYPYLLWRLLQGFPVPESRARVGVRWVRMMSDVPAAVRLIRQGRLSVRDYLWSLRPPIGFAMYTRDDPLPALVDLPMLAYFALRRLGGGSGL